jgi:tetratricopeptide (TPR) repeat protein
MTTNNQLRRGTVNNYLHRASALLALGVLLVSAVACGGGEAPPAPTATTGVQPTSVPVGGNAQEAEEHMKKGRQMAQGSDMEGAIAEFSAAIEADPSMALAYYNRALAYENLGDAENAVADYSKAIEVKADFQEAYVNRGRVYAQTGETDAAIADFSEGIRLNENDQLAWRNRGLAYTEKGEYNLAIADFDQAIMLDPQDGVAYYHRAAAYALFGDKEGAIASYQKAYELIQDAGVREQIEAKVAELEQ